MIPIRRFNALLEARHEAMPRLHIRSDLGVMYLEKQPELPRNRIPDFRDLVSGAADLDELLLHYSVFRLRLLSEEGGLVEGGVLGVSGCAAGEVRLVLFALGVSEVGAFVGVEGEAKTAFESAEVVPQNVRVLCIDRSASAPGLKRS